MPARPPLTARRLRIAVELRKMRERSGMTATEAARTLGTSQGQLSNVESGRFGVSPERIRSLAGIYSCPDPGFVEALVEMATDRTFGWWESYREVLPSGLLDLAELEHHAIAVRTAYTSHMPGLLQTADHAREIFRHVIPEPAPPEIEHRVSHRIKRQGLLHGADPTPYRTTVHEAALHMRVGGRDVARAQLRHLIDMSEQQHITIRVLPFDVGAFPGSGQSINYLYGPVPQLDTAQLDQFHGPVLLDAEALLTKYRNLLDVVEGTALSPEKSRDLIRSIAQNL
ncbi:MULTISPECIES: helix-turn-helix transcriptional regulator [unclassified Streptomyces]|jgi:transcriptional regulator with XRE-family HTH domain|uniref:helix-turn-helix domain-containing protein n=1 Tax=unclassified Streptomyces TaxID=2593676 RepID=UPI001BAFC9AA|nr:MULTISPECIES: helix-turn-helix transcriptional regulator [unclassified Streptomyces]MDH6450890.1 transcriptional regulator with XRE-family HTH domain [Streptomyces sp. SAI-119]MDH6498557.1 transcriptional regulator with XRE-family HTH domain [Streptomyces sp. SAI-149]QUC62622.1 helix-turn-helix transcriptional regulator [Streptomyces sp. A2-16]